MKDAATVRDSADIRVDGARLWSRLMEMAKIGATPAGGCNRQALTDEDKAGRDLFCDWAKKAGCEVDVDEMGNIWARRPGSDTDAAPVVSGSHLDTQPTGGKFDGVYGVLAALEVVETLNDANLTTKHPVEVLVWTNEEGARFEPAMIGSGVYGGAFSLEDAHATKDKEGKTLGGELDRIGYLGKTPCQPKPIHASFEAHIEQGPILEAEDITVGVVRGVQGMRWFKAHISGQPVHAGPTPMTMRKDPVKALGLLTTGLYEVVAGEGEDARATFGDIKVSPGVTNTVPETVILSIDLRHPDEAVVDRLEAAMKKIAEKAILETGVEIEIEDVWRSPAVQFDNDCISAVRSATEKLGIDKLEMVSGAGHDSVYLSRVAPTSMIFVPCKDGISHNEAEDADPAHLENGANVLLHAVLDRAL